MIRSEIIQKFRDENPEITSRVIGDTTLNMWCLLADKQFCAATRCIVDQDGTAWNVAVNDEYYDLTSKITNFYDIDDWPGSGVVYNGKRINKATMSELDLDSNTWRSRGAGTPQKWYRRGKYLYLDRPAGTAITNGIRVYAVLKSTDWDTDIEPFNQLSYLEPFTEAIILYLVKRAKAKVGKPEEAAGAHKEWIDYLSWAKTQLGGNKSGPIFFRKKQTRNYGRYT